MAYELGHIKLHEKIKVRMPQSNEGESSRQLVETSVGRVIFNEVIPDKLGFYNEVIDKKKLGEIVYECYRLEGNAETAIMLDGIKRLGYKFSTQAGITVGVNDFETPEAKNTY